MRNGTRAIIRDSVAYGEDGAYRLAPRGEYRLEERTDCIGFCNCNGQCDFTLSLDAFHQHVSEGRIAVRVQG